MHKDTSTIVNGFHVVKRDPEMDAISFDIFAENGFGLNCTRIFGEYPQGNLFSCAVINRAGELVYPAAICKTEYQTFRYCNAEEITQLLSQVAALPPEAPKTSKEVIAVLFP